MEAIATDWSKVADGVTENDSRFAMDHKLHVQFYLKPILMAGQSEVEGRPIFKDIEHVRVLVPGDKLNIIDRIASPEDKQRFAAHYAKFQAGKGDEVIGTRLEAVPWMTRSKVEEYKFFGVHTVEQLANANDQVGQKFPGFNQDRLKAQQFLESINGTDAKVAALTEELEKVKAMLAQQAKPEVKIAAK
jgi:hypothetical protein